MSTVTIFLQHLFSAAFPGLGHFLIRRPVRATFFALVFFYCVEGALLWSVIDHPVLARSGLNIVLMVGVFVWLYAHYDLIAIRRLRRLATDDLFLDGVRAYLSGNMDCCEAIMRRMLLADPADVASRMYLSLAYRDNGMTGAARRQLKACRRHDLEGAFSWEINSNLQRLKTDRAVAS